MTLSTDQLRWFRLRRSGLVTPFDSPEQAAGALAGVQAQILPAAGLSLWNRTTGLTHQRFDELLHRQRSLVKLWGQRHTLHLYPSAEWPLLHGALTGQTTWWERQAVKNGADINAYRATIVYLADLLRERGTLSRSDLRTADFELDDEHFSSWGGIFASLVREGYACHAGQNGNEGRFAHREYWLPGLAWNPPPSDEANVELARRYLSAYGPATMQDLAYWRGTSVSNAWRWLTALGDEIVEIESEGQTLLALRADLAALHETPPPPEAWPVRLLYRFDPLLLGLKDKSWIVDPAHYSRVWRPAGHIEGTVLDYGRISGTWRYDWKGSDLVVSVFPFGLWSEHVRAAVEEWAAGVAAFFGVKLVDIITGEKNWIKFKAMTEHKPVEISEEDWGRTPPAVRAFISRFVSQLAQLEAQPQAVSPALSSPVEPAQPRLRPRRTLNRLVLIALALALAAAGQYLLIYNSLWDGLFLYLLAAILLVRISGHVTLSNFNCAWPGLAQSPQVRQGFIQTLGLGIVGGAALLGLVAYFKFGQIVTLPQAWTLYVYSMATLILGVLLLTRTGETQPLWPQSSLERGLLLFIFGLTVFMRLWQIEHIPFGTWYDEAISGLQGVRWNNDPLFRPQFEENNPGQLIFLFATVLRWFGQTTTAIRLVSVALGLAAVGAAYLFGSELRGPRWGLAVAFLVAVARWHVNFSRIAMPGIDTPLAEFLALFFLLRLWRYGRLRDAAWAGIALGLGLSFYSAFRLFVLALVLFAFLSGLLGWKAWWANRKDNQRRHNLGTHLAMLALALSLTALPVIQFAVNNPTDFWARVQKTSILTRRDEPDLGKAIWRSTAQHLLMFNFQGDRNGRHNLPGEPMLDPAMGVLFVLGFGLALARLRRPAHLFFLILFAAGLLGGILSLDFEAPQALRSIGVLPAVFYFCALSLAVLSRQIAADLRPWPASWLAIPLAALGGFIFYANAQTYFYRQAHEFATWNAFSTAESIIGARMAQLGPDYTFYLSPFFNEHPAIRFLSPATKERRLFNLPDALPVRQPADRPAALFIHPDDKWIYDSALRLYPAANFEIITDDQTNTPVVYMAELTREDVAQIQGVELRYWPNQTWTGPPQTSLGVKTIEQFWPDATSLALSATSADFAAEWSGVLYAPDYGSYAFTLRTPASASLEIDGNIVVSLENAGQQIAPVQLAQGNHRLRLRALGGTGQISLLWQRPGQQIEIIPAWVLYRPPVIAHGLQGAYYANANWVGSPALMRIDPFLDMYFHITPLPRPYTVEWHGVLAAPQAGDYHLGLRAVDEAKLYLDGQLLVTTSGPDALTLAPVTLEPGLHDLRLTFKDATGRSRLHLLWQPPGQAAAIPILSQYLWPSRSSYVEVPPAELPPPQTPAPAQVITQPLPTFSATGQVRLLSPDLGETPLNQPRGIAIGPNGQGYLTDTGNNRLLILDQAGNVSLEIKGGAEPFGDLSDVAVDSTGRVYVLDVGRGHLSVFDAEGNYLQDVAAQPTYIGHSRGLFVDPQNYIWLANTSANRVVALDLAGNVLVDFPVSAELPAQPVDVAVTADGSIYVTDVILDQLIRFGVDGQPRQSWTIPHSTSLDGAHLAVDGTGGLYLTLPEASQVLHLGPNGEAITQWDLIRPDGQKMKPVGVAVVAAGQVWVVDSAGGAIAVLSVE